MLVDLYRSEEDDRRRGRPHRTPARLMCRLLRALTMEFPRRRFVLVGDADYGSPEVARFFHRRRARLSLVSKLHPDANLLEPPPPYGGTGRPRVEGGRRPKPRKRVDAARRRRRLTVGWYGGGSRRVEVITGSERWYNAGDGLALIRRVFVHDRAGTNRDEYFYTTDPGMGAGQVVARYAGRWNLECTFQEGRAHLHSEGARGRSRRTLLLATPCLLGLYSVVALLYDALPVTARVGGIDWPGKTSVTFSDALSAVRLRLWFEGVFREAGVGSGLEEIPTHLRELLCRALAPAA